METHPSLPSAVVLWDIENCPIPKHCRPKAVVAGLRSFVTTSLRARLVDMIAVLHSQAPVTASARAELKASRLRLIEINSSKPNAADFAIILELFRIVSDPRPALRHIVLITGDKDFAPFVELLVSHNFLITLLSNRQTARVLRMAAQNVTLTWEDVTMMSSFLDQSSTPSLALQHIISSEELKARLPETLSTLRADGCKTTLVAIRQRLGVVLNAEWDAVEEHLYTSPQYRIHADEVQFTTTRALTSLCDPNRPRYPLPLPAALRRAVVAWLSTHWVSFPSRRALAIELRTSCSAVAAVSIGEFEEYLQWLVQQSDTQYVRGYALLFGTPWECGAPRLTSLSAVAAIGTSVTLLSVADYYLATRRVRIANSTNMDDLCRYMRRRLLAAFIRLICASWEHWTFAWTSDSEISGLCLCSAWGNALSLSPSGSVRVNRLPANTEVLSVSLIPVSMRWHVHQAFVFTGFRRYESAAEGVSVPEAVGGVSMEPAVDSDEEDTIRYAGYTAVMLAPEHEAINHIEYAQVGDDDGDIQQATIVPDINGNHLNGNHADTLEFDDERPPDASKTAPAPQFADVPRPLLSRNEPMEAARVSEVLEAMAGIQLRAPPPWLMSTEWQQPLRGRVPNLKAPASTALLDMSATPPAPAATASGAPSLTSMPPVEAEKK